MMAARRPWRTAVSLLAATALLLAALYVTLAADHNCAGEDCAVCAQLAACDGLLRGLRFAAPVITVTATLRSAAGTACRYMRRIAEKDPVGLRVELTC